MKTFAIATVACTALLSISSVDAMESFLAKIPNGSLFGKWLGHTASDYTTFGTDFSSTFEWNERLCKLNSLSSTMTNGEALGDPCCTWKAGASAQTITAWKDGGKPSVKTVCASAGGSTTPTVTTKAPATATTTAPATPPKTTAPATTSATKTPASKSPSSKTPSKTSKAPSKKCTKKPKRM